MYEGSGTMEASEPDCENGVSGGEFYGSTGDP